MDSNSMVSALKRERWKLVAEVPMAEMANFATVLRSVTAGRGSFTFDFTRYEDAPAPVAEKVIAESKLLEEE